MHPRPPTTSRLANLAAQAIREGFSEYRRRFRALTAASVVSFERRDWAQSRGDSQARLALYRQVVDAVEERVRGVLGERGNDRVVWVGCKAVYSGLIAERQDWDIAETFFNSITRRVFRTVGVDPLIEFVDTDFDAPPTTSRTRCFKRYEATKGPRFLFERVLIDRTHSINWDDLRRDATLIVERLSALLGADSLDDPLAAELLRPIFYRGKGAYVVGRLLTTDDEAEPGLPFALALRNGPSGLFVDAALLGESEVSDLFCFTRSYFHVDTPRPHDLVRFLAQLLPSRTRGELYISMGHPKQGKTELYRDVLAALETTDAQFVHAPGVKGLVMVVFLLPGLDLVFKVIRDRFPPNKPTSAAKVKDRYRWVYTHDRAGRLVDAQPFEHLQLPLDRFSPALLDELFEECGRSARVESGDLILGLAYVEARVRPLDLYLREVDEQTARAAVLDFGEAIRDMAACNIFPGDMLCKNFGVTDQGRVAFYDYDELTELTTCRFREIPEARNEEDELRAEPWFSVGPDDVFPEEFPRFLGFDRSQRKLFRDRHGDLFEADWWRGVQRRVRDGKIVEFSPFHPDRRLPVPREGGSGS